MIITKKADNNPKKKLNKEELLARYEELLLQKEQYIKDGNSYRISYVKEFGELTAEVFKAKMECIRLKKTIAFCQREINAGKKIDVEAMNKSIELDMLAYKAELQSILKENKEASECETVTRYDFMVAKQIYRRLAKKLHPDINKMTEKEPKLKNLWNEVMNAYYKNDADRLEELEVLVNAALKELGEEVPDVDIEDLEDRIEALEIKIGMIVSDKPYTYGELLLDDEKVKQEKEKMNKELKEYQDYALELEEILSQLLLEGGATLTWRMN
ncbi:MAG: hypothetical protein IKS56_09705 [Lachnospiraceae bacterium]|nr:hypothetical protein [Lachnospiraceae bacterium]